MCTLCYFWKGHKVHKYKQRFFLKQTFQWINSVTVTSEIGLQVHTHTHIHARTYTCTHASTHARTHTHTYQLVQSLGTVSLQFRSRCWRHTDTCQTDLRWTSHRYSRFLYWRRRPLCQHSFWLVLHWTSIYILNKRMKLQCLKLIWPLNHHKYKNKLNTSMPSFSGCSA